MTTDVCKTQHGRDPRCLHRAELHESVEFKVRGKCTAEGCGCTRYKRKKRGGSSLRKSAPMRKLKVPLNALQINERKTGQPYDLIVNPLLKWVDALEDGELLFQLGYWSYWAKLKDLVPDRMISSHLFRHDRITKLGEANIGPLKIQAWNGWTDQRPLKSYLDLERIDLEEVGEVVK